MTEQYCGEMLKKLDALKVEKSKNDVKAEKGSKDENIYFNHTNEALPYKIGKKKESNNSEELKVSSYMAVKNYVLNNKYLVSETNKNSFSLQKGRSLTDVVAIAQAYHDGLLGLDSPS